MITITSKAGQRLAKAGRALWAAEEAVNKELERIAESKGAEFDYALKYDLDKARQEWQKASEQLTNELIASRHHEAEGD